MGISGIGTQHYPAWQEAGRAQKNRSGIGFASRMADMVGTNAFENGRKTNAVSGRDNYAGGDTASIYSMGVYSRKDISASQDLNLPIETERYKIEDAGYMEGVPAYEIVDKLTGRGLYIREDQLMVQKDEKTGLRYLSIRGNEAKGVSVVITSKADWEILEKMADEFSNGRVLADKESEKVDRQESKTKTDIIVRPDGSRVLVMTMSIGGMETTMSLEISKPTEAPNENSKQDTDNNIPSADAEMDTVSDEMSNISTED